MVLYAGQQLQYSWLERLHRSETKTPSAYSNPTGQAGILNLHLILNPGGEDYTICVS